eukprot:15012266-Alexandrium_andersonii.AAC.1
MSHCDWHPRTRTGDGLDKRPGGGFPTSASVHFEHVPHPAREAEHRRRTHQELGRRPRGLIRPHEISP